MLVRINRLRDNQRKHLQTWNFPVGIVVGRAATGQSNPGAIRTAARACTQRVYWACRSSWLVPSKDATEADCSASNMHAWQKVRSRGTGPSGLFSRTHMASTWTESLPWQNKERRDEMGIERDMGTIVSIDQQGFSEVKHSCSHLVERLDVSP